MFHWMDWTGGEGEPDATTSGCTHATELSLSEQVWFVSVLMVNLDYILPNREIEIYF